MLDRSRELVNISLKLKQEVAQAIAESIIDGDNIRNCNCSTIGTGADLEMQLRTPVLRVDRPMAWEAVAHGDRILVAAGLASTLLMADAWPDWVAGNKQAYWNRIAGGIEEHIHRLDAVVLAQASMASAASLLTQREVPVLSSSRPGVAEAIRRMAASA